MTTFASWLRHHGAEDVFRNLVDLMCDAAIFAVDADRNIVYWSPGAERLLGFSADEVLGSHCLKGIRCARCMIGCGIAEHKRVQGVPLILHRSDGSPVAMRKTAMAFFTDDGRFDGGIEVLFPDPSAAFDAPTGAVAFHGLISRDPAMLRMFDTIRNVAETDATVLVRGESGTGKELVARAIHAESHRREGPFVAVNCASLTPGLVESELFGHVRGAFTGAVSDRVGLFGQADGGTLFLDEVAELPIDVQARLLRVLQERTFSRVGEAKERAVDVRVVAATHRGLREEVKAGRFREDLMFRLRVVPLFLPPLRDRRTDIELLLWSFITDRNKRGPRRVREVAPEAMRRLLDHDWPGNVRELVNAVDYAFAVGRSPILGCDDLPPELRATPPGGVALPSAPPSPPNDEPEDEAAAIRRALAQAGGHVGRAAELMGVSRPTFWRRRKALGV